MAFLPKMFTTTQNAPMTTPIHKKVIAFSLLAIIVVIISMVSAPFSLATSRTSEQTSLYLAHVFEIISVITIISSFIVSFIASLSALIRSGPGQAYRVARRVFGRGLLLSLEILIAADLMHTVLLNHALSNLLTLGLLVVIRTILSWSIVIEIEGDLPWRLANK